MQLAKQFTKMISLLGQNVGVTHIAWNLILSEERVEEEPGIVNSDLPLLTFLTKETSRKKQLIAWGKRDGGKRNLKS